MSLRALSIASVRPSPPVLTKPGMIHKAMPLNCKEIVTLMAEKAKAGGKGRQLCQRHLPYLSHLWCKGKSIQYRESELGGRSMCNWMLGRLASANK
ncbi:hypothetical protein VNO78_25909 [Psophocarpus tetragonolobus]|uniref:Uncharacterized protein n=1 Tax=Psophocarpus tetragonolobus TaxID=3891 RepID=A0AAN9XFS4_PSOTE